MPVAAPNPDASAASEEPDYRHRLGLDGQLRFYNLASPVTVAGLSASYRFRVVPDVSLGLFGEGALGSAQRTGGQIDVRVFHIGLGAEWRLVHVSLLSLTGRLRGAGTIVQLAGHAQSDAFGADSVTGGTGSVMLALMPAVTTGRAELALPLELAFVFRAPRGLVGDEPEVRIDGVSFGAGLSVALGLGAPMQPARARMGAAR